MFAAVQAGTYTVKAELSGFQTIETKGIVMRLGETRNLTSLKLGVAGLTEQVAVTASGPSPSVVSFAIVTRGGSPVPGSWGARTTTTS